MQQKIIILVIWLITVSQITVAQNKKDTEFYRDTIRLMMPNGVTIDELTCYKHKGDLNALNDLADQLKAFTKRWKVLNTTVLSGGDNIHITFTHNNENSESERYTISFKAYTPSTQITFPVDTSLALLPKGRHQLEIITYQFRSMTRKTVIRFNTLEQLEAISEIDFEALYQETEDAINTKDNKHHLNKPLTTWIEVDEHNTPQLQYLQIGPHHTDVIELSFGSTLENVKGEWNAGFYSQMHVKLGHKTTFKHNIFVGYDWMYSFSGNSNGDINHWLSAGYGHNFPKDTDKNRWFTVSLGYLVKRNGTLFKENSFRLGIEKEITNIVSVTPQMYFNDFFEGIYPGIQFNINF